jgi:hypothetical protein
LRILSSLGFSSIPPTDLEKPSHSSTSLGVLLDSRSEGGYLFHIITLVIVLCGVDEYDQRWMIWRPEAAQVGSLIYTEKSGSGPRAKVVQTLTTFSPLVYRYLLSVRYNL